MSVNNYQDCHLLQIVFLSYRLTQTSHVFWLRWNWNISCRYTKIWPFLCCQEWEFSYVRRRGRWRGWLRKADVNWDNLTLDGQRNSISPFAISDDKPSTDMLSKNGPEKFAKILPEVNKYFQVQRNGSSRNIWINDFIIAKNKPDVHSQCSVFQSAAMASQSDKPEMQTIEIDKLNVQQLSQMKQQLDQEVGLFNDSLQQLKVWWKVPAVVVTGKQWGARQSWIYCW